MNKICDNCETAIHCAKYGCIPERIGKPAQQETSNESAYQRGYLDGMAKPCVECADRKLKEMAKHPSVQQEADLSGLKPATQEVIKGWIEDGTFIERAIGAMQEQEAENMRLDKALAEQPAQQQQQEPAAIGCKCSECGAWQRWTPSGMVCKNGHGGVPGVNHRLYTSPPAQRKPLTDDEITSLWEKRPYFNDFARAIEAAHGIKENT